MQQLWAEKYRPQTLLDYVFKDSTQQQHVQYWIKEKSIPHLLFSGAPGVGKTTLAKVLINELDVDPYDVLEINASRENSVDVIREKITGFVQTLPFGNFKVVLLDEADYISANGQAALRGVMETYASTARFILTCNYPNRIIPALHSRCQGFHIERVDIVEFTARLASILVSENIDFDLDVLDTYVKANYPDLRKCINMCQMNAINNTLTLNTNTKGDSVDWRLNVVDLFKRGDIRQARSIMVNSVKPEEAEDMFRWMYDNLDLWGKTEEVKDEAILIIRDGLVNHTSVADIEINLSATLIELGRLNT